MNSITVYCGNGGHWEWERDKQYWIIWIAHNIPGCSYSIKYHTYTNGFIISYHDEADKAIIEFDDPHNAVLFALKKPLYPPIWHEND